MSPQLKLLPPTKPRLGLYLRPGRNDHKVFEQLLAEDRAVSGLVLDARHTTRHAQLRELLVDNGVHAVLDTDVMELATPGGSVLSGLELIPWAAFGGASAAELRGSTGERLAAATAEFVRTNGFSAVLAPTHLLESAGDPMFGADRAVANELRRALDARGLQRTAVFYPLAIPGRVFRDRVQRALIITALSSLDIDSIWLRIYPFGTSNAGSIALRQYIEAAWDLRRVGVPLVGERTGTVGLALMAATGCRDVRCCRNGIDDMLRDPRRHFVLRRTAEVDRIGGIAPGARANVYLREILQPAALLAIRATRVVPELEAAQRRLESWNLTLAALEAAGPHPVPVPAIGQRLGLVRPKPQSLQ